MRLWALVNPWDDGLRRRSAGRDFADDRLIVLGLADAVLAVFGVGRRGCPDPWATMIYDGFYRVYRRLYEGTAEEMRELARLSGSQSCVPISKRQGTRSAPPAPRLSSLTSRR